MNQRLSVSRFLPYRENEKAPSILYLVKYVVLLILLSLDKESEEKVHNITFSRVCEETVIKSNSI